MPLKKQMSGDESLRRRFLKCIRQSPNAEQAASLLVAMYNANLEEFIDEVDELIPRTGQKREIFKEVIHEYTA